MFEFEISSLNVALYPSTLNHVSFACDGVGHAVRNVQSNLLVFHIRRHRLQASDLQAFHTFAPMAADVDRIPRPAEHMSRTEDVHASPDRSSTVWVLRW